MDSGQAEQMGVSGESTKKHEYEALGRVHAYSHINYWSTCFSNSVLACVNFSIPSDALL